MLFDHRLCLLVERHRMRCYRLDSAGLGEGKVAGSSKKDNEILDSLKCGEFWLADKLFPTYEGL
jgi:hypothetical protein